MLTIPSFTHARLRALIRTALSACCLLLCLTAGTALAARAPHIVGGTSTTLRAWPSIASITDDLSNGTTASCSGSVVSANVVLTAAHCVEDFSTMTVQPAGGFLVSTGTASRLADSGQVSTVTQIVVAPSFSLYTLSNGSRYSDHDIALLELATPTTAPAITLPTAADWSAAYTAGTTAEVAGFGLTSLANAAVPTKLQQAGTVVQSDTFCAVQDLLGTDSIFDASDQICALDTPTDSTSICEGDSGGPLVTLINNVQVQIGVTSYTADCSPTEPNYYMDVEPYSAWIQGWAQHWMTPTVTDDPATEVTQHSADLSATLNPNAPAATYYFEWGTTTTYGTTTPEQQTDGDPSDLAVTAPLASGLTPGTAYHYRLVAISSQGTTYGTDRTFTTQPGLHAGSYSGVGGQRLSIKLRLNTALRLTQIKLHFTATCSRVPVAYTLTASPAASGWSLNRDHGMGFVRSFTGKTGTRYTLAGRFSQRGTASGTLTATSRRTTHVAACSSSTLHWSAH